MTSRCWNQPLAKDGSREYQLGSEVDVVPKPPAEEVPIGDSARRQLVHLDHVCASARERDGVGGPPLARDDEEPGAFILTRVPEDRRGEEVSLWTAKDDGPSC